MFSLGCSKSETFLSSLLLTSAAQLDSNGCVSRQAKCFVPSAGSAEEELYDADLVKALLSLPIMRPLLGLVKIQPASGNDADELEATVLSAVADAMSDACSPWAKLAPTPPPVVGPRTPKQYLSALDIAINARKAAKEKSKIAKFWKQEAIKSTLSLGEDVPLTPSPSDISDTGLSEPSSPTRRKRVEELIARRRIAVTLSEVSTDADTFWKELDTVAGIATSDVARSLDSSSVTCVSLSASPEPDSTEKPDLDAISADCRSDSASNSTKSRIPALKRHHTAPSQTSPSSLHNSTLPQNAKIVTRPHTCCNKSRKAGPGSQSSRTVLSPVQTKCRLYESLSSHPSSTPMRNVPLNRTLMPSTKNTRLEVRHLKLGVNAKLRKETPSTPHSPLIHASVWKTPEIHREKAVSSLSSGMLDKNRAFINRH